MTSQTVIKMCRQDIVKYDLHVKAYLQDIRECTGPIEVLKTLNLHVGENMKSLKSAIDDLQRIAQEQDSEEEKFKLLKEVETHRKQLANNQVALRKVNLACQIAIDKSNKEDLFDESPTRVRQRTRRDKESLAKQSSGVTDNLVAISSMLANQVRQTEDTLQVLVGTSGTVGDTNEEFKNMGSVIQQSSKLLTKYNRRELTNKVIIFLALAFFFSCVLYVMKKRLF